jgi:hypothetical protein
MQEDFKHTLCESTLYRIDSGAARIAAVWDSLQERGFGLIGIFFDLIDALKIDDIETEPRKYYFAEKAREVLTCQYAYWSPDRTTLKAQRKLFYISQYLEWIETQHNSKMWRYTCDGDASTPLGPVMARYLEVFKARSGSDRELANAFREKINQTLDVEASELLRRHSELIELRVGDEIKEIKGMIELSFQGTGFSYDSARSTRSVVSYSYPIPNTEACIVCTFEGVARFDSSWSWQAGIMSNDVKKPLSYGNMKSSPEMFPIVFYLEDVFPNCSWYLNHFGDEKLKKLGCMFYATAMSLLADAICDGKSTASAHSPFKSTHT